MGAAFPSSPPRVFQLTPSHSSPVPAPARMIFIPAILSWISPGASPRYPDGKRRLRSQSRGSGAGRANPPWNRCQLIPEDLGAAASPAGNAQRGDPAPGTARLGFIPDNLFPSQAGSSTEAEFLPLPGGSGRAPVEAGKPCQVFRRLPPFPKSLRAFWGLVFLRGEPGFPRECRACIS